MANFVTEIPKQFYHIGQVWEWNSGHKAEVMGYHPTEIVLLMRCKDGKSFWYCPVVLGQVAHTIKSWEDSRYDPEYAKD